MRLALRVRAMRSCKIAPGNFVDPLLGFSSHCNKKPTITPKSKAAVLFLLTLVWLWVIRRLVSTNIMLSKLGGKCAIQSHLIWVYYTASKCFLRESNCCLCFFALDFCSFSKFCNFHRTAGNFSKS